jgi:hypothetical protein
VPADNHDEFDDELGEAAPVLDAQVMRVNQDDYKPGVNDAEPRHVIITMSGYDGMVTFYCSPKTEWETGRQT